MPTQEYVLQSFDIEYRRLDRYIRAMLERSEQFKRDYQRDVIDEFISRMLIQDGYLINAPETWQALEEMQFAANGILEANGLPLLVEDLFKIMNERIRTINYLTNKLGLDQSTLSREAAYSIPAVVESLNIVATVGIQGREKYVPEISQAVLGYRNTLTIDGRLAYKEFIDDYMQKVGTIPKYAGTVASTMMARMDRILRKEQGKKAGIDKARYVGPVDKLTRKYCRRTVGKIKTWEEWETTTNDTGPQPVAEWGGGWNCRHALIFWDESWK
jgi:hypothetical protein